MPEVGSTVLCKVTRITPKQASVAILVVGETVLEGEWAGVIRVQDVRATEKDRVKVGESFRPGDIVRAVVVSGSLCSITILGLDSQLLSDVLRVRAIAPCQRYVGILCRKIYDCCLLKRKR